MNWQTLEARYKAMVYDTIADMNLARCPAHCGRLLVMLNTGADEQPKGYCPDHPATVYWVDGTQVEPLPTHRQPGTMA